MANEWGTEVARLINAAGGLVQPIADVEIVAATGTNQATAAALSYPGGEVTGADGTTGVILPVTTVAGSLYVYNSDTSNNLKVYPQTGGSINAGASDAAVLVGPERLAIFQVASANVWGMILAPPTGSAFTQTYSTADRTIANPTAAALTVTDGAGTNDNTIGAITDNATTIAAVQELAAQINKLIVDVADVRSGLTALIDDCQAAGISG